jgi:hypothetical protein
MAHQVSKSLVRVVAALSALAATAILLGRAGFIDPDCAGLLAQGLAGAAMACLMLSFSVAQHRNADPTSAEAYPSSRALRLLWPGHSGSVTAASVGRSRHTTKQRST